MRSDFRPSTVAGTKEAAALRDFDPADVRFGSIASEIIGTMRRPMSASSRKQTKYYAPFSVCFVPVGAGACMRQVDSSIARATPAARARFPHAYFSCRPDSLTVRSAVSRSSRMKRANSSSLIPDGSTARSMYIRCRKSRSLTMRATSCASRAMIGCSRRPLGVTTGSALVERKISASSPKPDVCT